MNSRKADIIVIGAGAAGLAAACKLGQARKKVLILEARSRTGGRVYTLPNNNFADFSIELGAEFVHGTAQEIFNPVRAANLETVETKGKSWCLQGNERLVPCGVQASMYEDEIWRRLANYDGRDLSFESFLEKSCAESQFERARSSVLRYIEGFHAAESNRASVLGIQRAENASEEIEGERAFRFPKGYQQIIKWFSEQALKNGAGLYLSCAAKIVRWKAGAVEIVATDLKKDETVVFRAPQAIISLPLGVLRAAPEQLNFVLFEPPLEAKKNALEKLEMGAAVRVVLHFERDWWTEKLKSLDQHNKSSEKLGFLFAAQESFTAWWTPQPIDAPLLTAWTGGTRAKNLIERGKEFVENEAICSLARIFNLKRAFVESELVSVYYHDWSNDSFARGAYSYVGVGGIDAGQELARPLEDTLFFAGEATDFEGHLGTVHGAIRSGERAAAEVLGESKHDHL